MRSYIVRKLVAGFAVAGLLTSPLFVTAASAEGPAGKAYLGVATAATHDGDAAGLTLREVDPDGPAGKAGLKEGDRIETAGDKEVTTFDDLKKALAAHKPGDPLVLKVLHDGKEQTLTVTLGETTDNPGPLVAPVPTKAGAYLGVQAQALTPEMKDKLGVSIEKGAVVADVMPGSPAAKAGLKDADVVTQVGAIAVTGPEDLRDALQKVGAGKEAVLKVVRGKQEMELKAALQEAPSAALLDGIGELPEGFEQFSGRLPELFHGMEKASLEKKVQELEKRVQELEQKLAK